ncbi:MAG TPA: hypothetical protein VGE74_30335, partial [Gemmata sp.]
MPSPKFYLRSVLPSALVAGLAAFVLGCSGGDGVQMYTAPKAEGAGPGAPAGGDYRLLGLMVPADNPVWFFKYNGPADELNKYEADFDKLAASVKMVGGEPEFTPPEGWKRGPGRDGFVKVFATVLTNDGKQEVSITQSGGGVETNLNRWVGMIGLQPGPDDTTKYTKVIDGAGVKVRRIDLRGPKNPATNRAPMMG